MIAASRRASLFNWSAAGIIMLVWDALQSRRQYDVCTVAKVQEWEHAIVQSLCCSCMCLYFQPFIPSITSPPLTCEIIHRRPWQHDPRKAASCLIAVSVPDLVVGALPAAVEENMPGCCGRRCRIGAWSSGALAPHAASTSSDPGFLAYRRLDAGAMHIESQRHACMAGWRIDWSPRFPPWGIYTKILWFCAYGHACSQ